MGDVVEFRPKKLTGFIPNDLGEALPGLPQAFTIIPAPGLTVDDIFPPWSSEVVRPAPVLDPVKIRALIDTACSEITPDSGDCA